MQDRDIDQTDVPEIDPAKFARGLVRRGLKPVRRKDQLTLRIDSDVLKWFRGLGDGYQTRINAILKAYMDAHESAAG